MIFSVTRSGDPPGDPEIRVTGIWWPVTGCEISQNIETRCKTPHQSGPPPSKETKQGNKTRKQNKEKKQGNKTRKKNKTKTQNKETKQRDKNRETKTKKQNKKTNQRNKTKKHNNF